MRLACHRLGEQGLAGAGRTDQQRALRQLRADGGVFLRIVQEIDDLHQRFLCLVLSRNVAERHAGLLFHIDLGLALSDASDPAEAAASAAAVGDDAHQQEQAEEEDQRQDDPVKEHGRAAVFDRGGGELDPVLLQGIRYFCQIDVRQAVGVIELAPSHVFIRAEVVRDLCVGELRLFDRIVRDGSQERIVAHFLLPGGKQQVYKAVSEQDRDEKDGRDHEQDDDRKTAAVFVSVIIRHRSTPEKRIFCIISHFLPLRNS